MFTKYKGYTILKTFKHGYNYYRIVDDHDGKLYSRLKDAKAVIDKRTEVK